MDKTGAYAKPQTQMILARSLVGRGVATTEGEEWALHRRVVSPAFQHDKIKVCPPVFGISVKFKEPSPYSPPIRF